MAAAATILGLAAAPAQADIISCGNFAVSTSVQTGTGGIVFSSSSSPTFRLSVHVSAANATLSDVVVQYQGGVNAQGAPVQGSVRATWPSGGTGVTPVFNPGTGPITTRTSVAVSLPSGSCVINPPGLQDSWTATAPSTPPPPSPVS